MGQRAEELNPEELSVTVGESATTALVYRARPTVARPAALILAHGAGGNQHHPFMASFARALRDGGLDVITFNFLYSEQKRRVPDRMPQLVACYRAVIAAVAQTTERLFIGGKSMGGRAATHVVAEDPSLPVGGIVLLGYPLHPPGHPEKSRDAHLPDVRRPMLFVQGSRDAFGTPSELKPILGSLTPLPTLHTVHGGDHSFKVAGRKQADVYEEIQNAIVEWTRGSLRI